MGKVADFSYLSTVLVKSFKYQTKRELLIFESVLFGPLGVHKMSGSVNFLWNLECVLNLTLLQMFKMKPFWKCEDYR